MAECDELVDLEHRTVSPRVFTDPDVYRAEQERVFGRCWLYVAHESQIPQPGDFVTNYMGEESGDVKAAVSEGKYDRAKVVDLKEVLVGKAQGRTRVQQMVLFKSVGTAVQDVMAGFVVYEEAVRQGRGQDIGEFLDLKTF